jgi:hypothetical protein
MNAASWRRPSTRKLALLLWLAVPALGQVNPSSFAERAYPYPPEKVKLILEQMHAFAGERLPFLDGFVVVQTPQLSRYTRPYFQYRIELKPGAGETVVTVEARISASYTDSQGHSEYRSLPSNGRLEADLLDRLQDALSTKIAKPAAGAAQSGAGRNASAGGQSNVTASAAPGSSASVPVAGAPEPVAKASKAHAASPDELDQILSKRQAVEKQVTELQSQIKILEAAAPAPVPTPSFVSVKRSGAGVMSRTNDGGPVLFRAQAEDEFEVASQQGDWTEIHLAGNSTGWIRSGELNFPAAATSTPQAAAAAEIQPSSHADFGFIVSHEEVNQFSGDWARLKGKRVLFVYVQPRGVISDIASDGRKLAFAKLMFSERYRAAVQSNNEIEGVVVIFMSGRGGIAAAALPDIREWVEGGLADAAFVKRCSLDPPEEFYALGTR